MEAPYQKEEREFRKELWEAIRGWAQAAPERKDELTEYVNYLIDSRPCVSLMGSGTCIYLRDGSKVVLRKTPRGAHYLAVEAQEIVRTSKRGQLE